MTSVLVFHVGCHKQLEGTSCGNHYEDGLVESLDNISTLLAASWL